MESNESSTDNQQKKPNHHTDYHHFTLNFDERTIFTRFKDVRVVLVAGCARRAEAQARYLESDGQLELTGMFELLTKDTSRFVLFKVGPVLVANHGMGAASMSIAIHELMLMCRAAQISHSITLIRFGTCGGVGVSPGTLCITTRALDSLLQDFVEIKICSKLVRRPCVMDETTRELIEKLGQILISRESVDNFEIRSGATVATNDFYEEQGRTTGAICEHTTEDEQRFLETLSAAGVINIEMESNYLAAMCHKLGVSFGVICVALTDRLASNKIEVSSNDITLYVQRLFKLNSLLVQQIIQQKQK